MGHLKKKEDNSNILNTILDCVKRLEKEMVETRKDIDVLKTEIGLMREVQIPVVLTDDEDCNVSEDQEAEPPAGLIRINQASNKLELIKNPDHRGPRTVDLGWVWEDRRLTLVERYHTMFQLLNKIQNGENADPLTENELTDLRKKLLRLARAVRNMIYVDFPGIRYFTELVTADQLYYQLVLEEKVSKSIDMNIFLCKDMWCARTLLRESFKSGNRGITTLQDIAREKVRKRRNREKEIMKEKARIRVDLRQKAQKNTIKVEAEEDPDYVAMNQAIKAENSWAKNPQGSR